MLELSAESICQQAIAEVGGDMNDFGDDGFREPLGVLIAGFTTRGACRGSVM